MWRNPMARLAIVDIRLNHARGLDGSEPRPRSNLPENAGACSNTASLFDGILTATLGFVLVADPSEDVAAQEPRRGMDARSRGFGRDARSPALSSGAHSRSLKELQPPTLGGIPTRRAKT